MMIRDIQVTYVNGMMADENSVESVKTTIADILNPSNAHGKFQVHVHPNNSAESARVVADVALIILGTGILCFAVSQETKKKGDGFSRFGGLLGIACIIAGLIDYSKIQAEKNSIAKNLAGRVFNHLSRNPKGIDLLILHGQGADIGYRALKFLGAYASQIRVITLGAMTTIPTNTCGRVTNFKFKSDLISNVAAFPFEGTRRLCDQQSREIAYLQSDDLFPHGAPAYLGNEKVKTTMCDYFYK